MQNEFSVRVLAPYFICSQSLSSLTLESDYAPVYAHPRTFFFNEEMWPTVWRQTSSLTFSSIQKKQQHLQNLWNPNDSNTAVYSCRHVYDSADNDSAQIFT